MMDSELLSVIIPVYNNEKYLEQCVNSIINQTYKKIEIILVNDGSTDCSGLLCDELSKKDARIRIIHKKNGGAISAKKRGLLESTGEYIAFVDSDDYIDSDMYEVLMGEMLKNKDDIITSGFHMSGYDLFDFFDENVYDKQEMIDLIYPTIVYNREKWHGGMIGSACTKIYRKCLLMEPLQNMNESLRQWEDTCYVYLPFFKANRIQVLRKAFYYYRENDKSVTRNFNKDIWKQCKFSFAYIEKTWDGIVPNDVKAQLFYVEYWAYIHAIELAIEAKEYSTLAEFIKDTKAQEIIEMVDYEAHLLKRKYRDMTGCIAAQNINRLIGTYFFWSISEKILKSIKNVIKNTTRRITINGLYNK